MVGHLVLATMFWLLCLLEVCVCVCETVRASVCLKMYACARMPCVMQVDSSLSSVYRAARAQAGRYKLQTQTVAS